MEEENPIKDILYSCLEKIGEENIQSEISQKKPPSIIQKIMDECFPKVMNLEGDKPEKLAGFATSLLHYLLTLCLIPSQRKIEHDNLDIDVVIPDFRTLKKNPKDSLVIIIPTTDKKEQIEKKIKKLSEIQPDPQNIWVVTENSDLSYTTYRIKSDDFFKLLEELNHFLKSTKKTQFKIFKS